MLYLASKSPRRAELLQRLGLSHRLLDVDVPEVRAPDEGAADYVRRVARDKARAGWSLVAGEPGARVLGADTEVVLDEEVFGKPADAADALAIAICHSWRGTGLLGAGDDSSVSVSLSGRLTSRGAMTPAQRRWAEAQAAQRRTGAVDPRINHR